MELNVLTLRHALTLARMAIRKVSAGPPPESKSVEEPVEETANAIDVRSLLAQRSVEDLNATAENYFAGLKEWTDHLAKPFATAGDAPGLLINFATVLQGMTLAGGMRVLDFGAGTGWTSRCLTQLGCEVIVLDVSATALQIARELYARCPVIGSQPPPRFLHFDGHRIDLPEASVDRILCFDAFHHAPNPDAVLAEFARVLAPGGIAAFAEPGPNHSRSPQSQFEMRTYGVLENDIDIGAIWSSARQAGFADIQLAAYNVPPFKMSLSDYEDLLHGGETFLRWAESTRVFLHNVRDFFLYRSGTPRLDSRQREGLACAIEAPAEVSAQSGQPIAISATVRNSGTATWLPSSNAFGGVSVGVHLFDSAERLINFDFHWHWLDGGTREIAPGEVLQVRLEMPPLAAGAYIMELDAVANHVCWFAQAGSKPSRIRVTIG